jgi:hypothetical protein
MLLEILPRGARMAAATPPLHCSIDWDRYGELSVLAQHGFSVDETWDYYQIPFGNP